MLVTFHSSADWDYAHLLRMKEELERLFERSVDSYRGNKLKTVTTTIRRTHILTDLETVYRA